MSDHDMPSLDLLSKMWGDITYDESAPMVKTYCSECGHETGEERSHAKTCTCMRCQMDQRLLARARYSENKGKTITFRKWASLPEGPK